MEAKSSQLLNHVRSVFLRGMVLGALLSLFVSLTTLVGPLFMIQVYTRIIPSKSYDSLYGLVFIGVFGVVIFGLLDYVRNWGYAVIGQNVSQKLNLPALRASVLKAMEGGVNEGAGALQDIAELRHFLSSSALSTPLDAFWSIVFIAALYLIHPVYSLVAVGFILLMVGFNIITDALTRQCLKDAQAAERKHVQDVASSLRHAEAIEAMGMLPSLVRVWRSSQIDMLEQSRIANGRIRIVLAFTKSIQKSLQMVTVATGAFLVLDNKIGTGVLFAGMVLTSQAVGPFASMVESWRSWINAGQAWRRVKRLVEKEGSVRQTMPAPVGDGDLLVENLVYIPEGRDVPVLHGISFSVSPGEVLGIAGPSGAGKSTLARCLTGIIKPTVGGVYLDGHSTWLWERGSFGKAVGYLPQSLSLIDGTIRQTIARMQDSDPRDVIRAAQQAGVHEMIGRLPHGYDTPVQEGMHMLSGGQRQRLALARALYGEPKLIILDEPNSNLDHVGEQALIAAIESVKARGGIVVMIAHRPSVMAIADKLLVIEDGAVSQYGPRTDVIEMITPGVRAVTRRPSA